MDAIRHFIVMLMPRRLARWLWDSRIDLGEWTGHVLGRALGGSVVWRTRRMRMWSGRLPR